MLALAAAGLVHGDLHPAAFLLRPRTGLVLGSMASASVATDEDQRCVDLAQLLTFSALYLGVRPALALVQRRLTPNNWLQ